MIENCFIYCFFIFLLPIIGLMIFILISYLKKKNTVVEYEANYSFIPEKPIDGSDENNPLDFGHPEIIESLYKMIGAVVKGNSLTIGLFGDWGSGKSSIAKGLESKLLENFVPSVLFDVWKHEGDGLRRTFLKYLVQELKKKKKNGKRYLRKSFKLSLNIDSNTKSFEFTKADVKEWLNVFYKGAIIISIFVIIVILLNDFLSNGKVDFDIDKYSNGLWESFKAWIPLSLIAKLFLKSSEGLFGNKVEVVNEKFIDPIQFEKQFKDVLKELKEECNKLVIIFDNLDRVSGKKSLEIISTIKTFLEPADDETEDIDVVFLIPCDEQAIERHLASSNTYELSSDNKVNYSREYLRKFFNTVLRIPKFNLSELVDYTQKQLVKTKITGFNNKGLASLIANQFRDNPRQIIQFINVLLAKFILFEERENAKEGPLPKDFAKENILQLAKYVMMEQRFPEILEVYSNLKIKDLNDKDEIARVENIFINKEGIEKAEKIIRQGQIYNFKKFISKTISYPLKNLDVFINTRQSKFHTNFPNSERMIKIITEDLSEEIKSNPNKEVELAELKKYIDNIEWKQNRQDFDYLINEILIENESQGSNEIEIIRLINSVINFFENFQKFDISNTLIETITGYLDQDNYLVQINYIVEPSFIFKHFLKDEAKYLDLRKRVHKQWSRIIKSQEKE